MFPKPLAKNNVYDILKDGISNLLLNTAFCIKGGKYFCSQKMPKIKAQKLNMTQVWQNTEVVPVTVLKTDDKEIFENLEVGKKVTISGKNKGRGFQGVVKRHGFSGMDKSHGTKHHLRAPGSIGSTDQARVIPGKKMPGRMGQETITIKNIKVIELHPEKNEILVKGAVPGMKGSQVELRI